MSFSNREFIILYKALGYYADMLAQTVINLPLEYDNKTINARAEMESLLKKVDNLGIKIKEHIDTEELI